MSDLIPHDSKIPLYSVTVPVGPLLPLMNRPLSLTSLHTTAGTTEGNNANCNPPPACPNDAHKERWRRAEGRRGHPQTPPTSIPVCCLNSSTPTPTDFLTNCLRIGIPTHSSFRPSKLLERTVQRSLLLWRPRPEEKSKVSSKFRWSSFWPLFTNHVSKVS